VWKTVIKNYFRFDAPIDGKSEAAEDVKSRGGRLQKAASGGIEARSGDQSARSAEKFFAFIFQLL